MLSRNRIRGQAIGYSTALVVLSMAALLSGCTKPEEGDTEPPDVWLTNPGDGQMVTDTVLVTASATDNDAVTRVDFIIDSTLAGSDNSEPYSHIWSTVGLRAGTEHTVQAKAYDQAGNEGGSAQALVTIGPDQPTEHCGTISTDETWLAFDNPHRITCDLEVEATLTLEQGVIVKFAPGACLRVGYSNPGALVADGAPGSAITFTSNANPPSPGDWDGIVFEDQTDDLATILDNCLIEYGGGNEYGNIYCRNASPKITNCTIRRSGKYGVYAVEGGFTDFSRDTVTGNAEYPLHIPAKYVHTLGSDNCLTGNTKDGIEVEGGFIDTTCTWRNQRTAYLVTGDLEVQGSSSPIMTIEAGTVLGFASGTGIRVGYINPGALWADGAPEEIVFTSSAFPHLPGDWDGITLHDNTVDDQSLLRYCRIEYGGANGYGNIYCRGISSALEIGYCTINYSLCWPIYLENSDPNIHDCRFYGNSPDSIGP